MQVTSVSLDVTKNTNFLLKNSGVSRTEEVCHINYIFFGSSLGIRVTVFRQRGLFGAPFISSSEKANPK